MKIRISKNGLENMKIIYESIGNLLNEYSDEFELTDENFKKVKQATEGLTRFQTNFILNTLIEVVGPDNESIRFV